MPYKPTLTLLSRSFNPKPAEEEPPALYKRHKVPPQVFGFPVSYQDLRAWADKHDFMPGEPDNGRCDAALKAIIYKLPSDRRYYTLIHNPKAISSLSFCIVIGTNFTNKALGYAQDAMLIKSCSDALGLDITPGWFRMSRG